MMMCVLLLVMFWDCLGLCVCCFVFRLCCSNSVSGIVYGVGMMCVVCLFCCLLCLCFSYGVSLLDDVDLCFC